MIDTHCHILPGLDDGADSYDAAIEMGRQLVAAGFDTVIATPHVMEGNDFKPSCLIKEKVHELNHVFQKNGVGLQVFPGAENYIFPDLAQWYEQGKIVSLADTHKYLLVELPMMNIPRYTEQVLFELQVAGTTPVIAHPERNRELFHCPEILVDWAEKGIKFQVNLGSFVGRYGSNAKNLAKILLMSDMVHFIGSDMHRPTGKSSYLETALYLLTEIGSSYKAIAAAAENPAYILEGVNKFPEKTYTLKTGKKHSTWNWMKSLLAGKIG